ncbi:hypothetical protein KA005_32740 [bacterium]|nr:hypothetical protein [bacterium]
MTYEAMIQNVVKYDDEIIIDVEFSNGVKTFTKTYPWVHMVDIDNNFEETVKMELKRINDLEDGFTAMKERIGDKIVQELI